MGMFKNRWLKLRSGRNYRVEFLLAQAKQAIPYQVRALLKQQGISQQELAKRAGLTQGVISRAANPTYGNLSINTCVRIAGGLDVAFIGKFVPYRELDRWLDHLNDESYVPTFEEEDRNADALFAIFDQQETDDVDTSDTDAHELIEAKRQAYNERINKTAELQGATAEVLDFNLNKQRIDQRSRQLAPAA